MNENRLQNNFTCFKSHSHVMVTETIITNNFN